MATIELDFDAFLDGIENASTFSTTTTTSPTTTDTDLDSGIANTPPMTLDLDNTVIDLDNLDLPSFNENGRLFDDPDGEFDWFSSTFFDGKNPSMQVDNSLFETLFSGVNPNEQEIHEPAQQIPSPPMKSPEIPSINNVIRLQSCSNTASIGPKCIKLEPKNSLFIPIQATKAITVANGSIITLPLATTPSLTTSSASNKRRRPDSPDENSQTDATKTISLEQLKRQYGHMSEEALKKHLRMIKNRESASLSRKRRKELMENLDTRVKDLADENESLKKENGRLLTRIHTLEMENEILKKYRASNGSTPPARKPLILMGVVLLVVFNVFTLKSLAPTSINPSNSLAVYNSEAAVVPGRTILSDRSRRDAYLSSNEADGTVNENPPNYPFIQCVAYINKTHSQRINQDLRSWVQDNQKKQQEKEPMVIPDPKSLTISSDPDVSDSSVIPLQHKTRKVARQTRFQSQNKGQLQPYQNQEPNYDDFLNTIDRRNDTLYFVSFKRDHLILPATAQNQTQRPKMSLILPASMANLNKSIHVPTNHVPMIKIDCEVEDTKLVFVKRSHVPLSHQDELFEYYSSISQATI